MNTQVAWIIAIGISVGGFLAGGIYQVSPSGGAGTRAGAASVYLVNRFRRP